MNQFYFFSFLICLPLSYTQAQPSIIGTPDDAGISNQFKEYWYQGKGEVSSYELVQACYGELHKGNAVLIFSAEDFSRSKQIKLEAASKSPSDAIAALKVNMMKDFETGLYEHSMMLSAFTPIEREANPFTLKVSSSIQDWRGQVFTQVNLQTYKYKVLIHSYVESDGDQEYQIDKLVLEDEIWNLIRINPELLPEGIVPVLPGAFASHLRHIQPHAEDAQVSFLPAQEGATEKTYRIEYTSSKRVLEIKFEANFPYTILGWTETYLDGDKELTTRATLKKTLTNNYWTKNHNSDAPLRQQLGLDK